MAKPKGSNSKKAEGQARKAGQAANKSAAAQAQNDTEDELSEEDTKRSTKKAAEEAKRAKAAQDKALRDAQEAKEAQEAASSGKQRNAKQQQKKSGRSIDLSQFDDGAPALNASNVDDALDVFEVVKQSNAGVDRHPERRVAAAFAKFLARRLTEVQADKSMDGLKLDQKKQRIRKEFEKSPENPFNQAHATYNVTTQELNELAKGKRETIEARLTASSRK